MNLQSLGASPRRRSLSWIQLLLPSQNLFIITHPCSCSRKLLDSISRNHQCPFPGTTSYYIEKAIEPAGMKTIHLDGATLDYVHDRKCRVFNISSRAGACTEIIFPLHSQSSTSKNRTDAKLDPILESTSQQKKGFLRAFKTSITTSLVGVGSPKTHISSHPWTSHQCITKSFVNARAIRLREQFQPYTAPLSLRHSDLLPISLPAPRQLPRPVNESVENRTISSRSTLRLSTTTQSSG